jgi:hypothetical protein
MNSVFINFVKKGDYKQLKKLYKMGNCDTGRFQNWALDYSWKNGNTKTVNFLLSTQEVLNQLDPTTLLLIKMRM